MKEELSAFMDAELGELDERRVLQNLSHDPELRRTWGRYHVARAAMTRQLEYVAPSRLADAVYQQLQHTTVEVRGRSAGYRWAGGLAAAASLAAIAVFGLSTLQQPSTPATPTLTIQTFTPTDAMLASATEFEDAEGRLNAYLVGHSEFMPTGGIGGMLPYVRVVTYDSAK